MEKLTVEEILTATRGKLITGHPTTEISNICIDSRTLQPKDLFIAIKGKNFDGHQFIPEALAKGAIGVVASNSKVKIANSILIQVKDTIEALGNLARYYREKFSPLVIGVTGSNGKTTTKEMIAALLSRRMKVVKAKVSYNNEIGVPLTIFTLDSQTQVLIVEMEMNILGGIRNLAKIAKPQIGVVTNIGDTHLEFLHSRENVMKEKSELVESLTPNGTAILNGDDELVMAIGSNFPKIRKLTFGLHKPAFVYANKITDLATQGTHFLLNGKYRVRLPVLGEHNIYNALAAAATAHVAGLAWAEIVFGLENFKPPPMRLEIIKIKDLTILNDTYNANPQSMRAALETLKKIKTEGRKIAVLGDMLELGEQSQTFHTELGKEAAKIADIIIAVGKASQAIIDGAKTRDCFKDNRFVCVNNEIALTKLIDIAQPKDTILIKGSRAMHLEEIVQGIKAYYEKKTN